MIRTNIHKHPIISKVMCWLGRHDYEVDAIEKISHKEVKISLRCFYCPNRKASYKEIES